MIIIPAIDLQAGHAVRLYKGDYTRKTVYSDKPWELAQNFERMGTSWLHIVDLDGAKTGTTENLDTIKRIKAETTLDIEVGGGIRSLETVSLYLDDIGVTRVILGTAALQTPEFLKAAFEKYGPEKIVVGVDIKNGFVSTSGWLETSTTSYLDFLKELEQLGVKYSVITDISKDGTLSGPNFELYETIAAHTNIQFVVSGGVRDKADICEVARRNYYAVIIGKAFYERKVDLASLLKSDQNKF